MFSNLKNDSYFVTKPFQDQRLDHFLAKHTPDLGLRGCKRQIRNGHVLVNGHPKEVPSYRIKLGDKIDIISANSQPELNIKPKLLAIQNDFYFFYKPSGLHSVNLPGSYNISLESLIPNLINENHNFIFSGHGHKIKLLQRLDFLTSGIICGTTSIQAEKSFREYEAAGYCQKHYLTLLCGSLPDAICVQTALSTSKSKKVKILHTLAPSTRWTYFEPIKIFTSPTDMSNLLMQPKDKIIEIQSLTLAMCHIFRGQRHQIRAHAASIGFPLYNDPLYGHIGDGKFFLENYFISFPGHKLFYSEENSLINAVVEEHL